MHGDVHVLCPPRVVSREDGVERDDPHVVGLLQAAAVRLAALISRAAVDPRRVRV